MYSDNELIARIIHNNDQLAFTTLVRKYQGLVRSILAPWCRNEPHVVDDLAQDTFLRVYLGLSQFRQDAKFSTWLYRVATNIAADKYRRKTLNFCGLDALDYHAQPCTTIQQHERRKDLDMAIRHISEPQKIAVNLCLAEGFSHEEAANAMRLPLGTLKSHVNRGRGKLQQLLGDWRCSA